MLTGSPSDCASHNYRQVVPRYQSRGMSVYTLKKSGPQTEAILFIQETFGSVWKHF